MRSTRRLILARFRVVEGLWRCTEARPFPQAKALIGEPYPTNGEVEYRVEVANVGD